MIELIKVVPVQNELGEGVIWDHQRQRVWWTDIPEQKLYRYDLITEELEQWETPERLCCFAPVQGQDCLVTAFANGFAFYDPCTGWFEWIEKVENDSAGTRLNDGRTDRQGRMWAGSMIEDEDTEGAQGYLYRLDGQLSLHRTIGKLQISNSLCWSPDSTRMYHCDTPQQEINWYPFDASTASLGDRQTFVATEEGCYPDGSIVDRDGYLWNAQWGGSKVVRYTPEGSVALELELPVSQPTCVAFAGKNVDHLIVTTARQNLSPENLLKQPLAGNLFIYKTDFTGLIERPFIVQE